MSGINKAVDEFARSERRTNIIIGVALLFLSLLFGWAISPASGPTQEIEGVVSQLIGLPSDTSEELFLVVELDNGVKVRSRIGSSVVYREGHRVRLLQQKPRFFGATIYRFQQYVDAPHNKAVEPTR